MPRFFFFSEKFTEALSQPLVKCNPTPEGCFLKGAEFGNEIFTGLNNDLFREDYKHLNQKPTVPFSRCSALLQFSGAQFT